MKNIVTFSKLYGKQNKYTKILEDLIDAECLTLKRINFITNL
jgi:hypothetical protein